MPGADYWLPGLGSTIINVAANLAFIEAVRRSPLSLTIPLLSLTPVFTTLLAIPLLGEIPETRQWLGIAAVVVGAFWLNLSRGSISLRNAWEAFGREPGSRLMVAVALMWSLAMPLDKMAVGAAGLEAGAAVNEAHRQADERLVAEVTFDTLGDAPGSGSLEGLLAAAGGSRRE